MTSLAIDIGNTSMKYAVFDNQSMIHHQRIMGHDVDMLASEVEEYHPTHTIVCATTSLSEQQQTVLSQLTKHTVFLSHTTPIPIRNLYKTPETLGMDRLAAAVCHHPLGPVYRRACEYCNKGSFCKISNA